jgi:hypothetical protein
MKVKVDEKAKAGFWLLKQAVLDFAGEHPEGIFPAQVKREFCLHREEDEEGKGFTLALFKIMAADKEIVQGPGNGAPYFLPVKYPPLAATGAAERSRAHEEPGE